MFPAFLIRSSSDFWCLSFSPSFTSYTFLNSLFSTAASDFHIWRNRICVCLFIVRAMRCCSSHIRSTTLFCSDFVYLSVLIGFDLFQNFINCVTKSKDSKSSVNDSKWEPLIGELTIWQTTWNRRPQWLRHLKTHSLILKLILPFEKQRSLICLSPFSPSTVLHILRFVHFGRLYKIHAIIDLTECSRMKLNQLWVTQTDSGCQLIRLIKLSKQLL